MEQQPVAEEDTKAPAAASRRVIDVLFYFAEHQPIASVKEIAEALQLPVPTVHRYVAMLRQQGILARSSRGRYRVMAVAESLGRAARAGNALIQVAEPFMRELAAAIDETVVLAQLIDGDAVCVHRIEASRRIRLTMDTGMRLPPLRGATSKILVSALPPAERDAHIDRVIHVNPELARERKAFLKEVDQAARAGWATSLEEIDEGVWASAALVRNGGPDVAAFTVPCPLYRLDEHLRQRIAKEVRVAARRISDALAQGRNRHA